MVLGKGHQPFLGRLEKCVFRGTAGVPAREELREFRRGPRTRKLPQGNSVGKGRQGLEAQGGTGTEQGGTG